MKGSFGQRLLSVLSVVAGLGAAGLWAGYWWNADFGQLTSNAFFYWVAMIIGTVLCFCIGTIVVVWINMKMYPMSIWLDDDQVRYK